MGGNIEKGPNKNILKEKRSHQRSSTAELSSGDGWLQFWVFFLIFPWKSRQLRRSWSALPLLSLRGASCPFCSWCLLWAKEELA